MMRPTPSRRWWSGCWPARTTASAGPRTGPTPVGSPRRAATSSTTGTPAPGAQASTHPPAERAPKLQRMREILAQTKALVPPREQPPVALANGPHTVFADFGKGAWQEWFRTGEAFGERPTEPGDLLLQGGANP